MLKIISNKLAVELDRIQLIEKENGKWSILFYDGTLKFINDFERIRIWEMLGEKVGNKERYCK